MINEYHVNHHVKRRKVSFYTHKVAKFFGLIAIKNAKLKERKKNYWRQRVGEQRLLEWNEKKTANKRFQQLGKYVIIHN